MAYDLYAFDLFAAPRDRHDFLDWISRAFRDMDGGPGVDPSRATPALRAWHAEMARGFSGARDPHSDDGAARAAHYRFTQSVVQASFSWDSSGPVIYRARRAAQAHGVGLFEASAEDGAVWMISQRGRWEVVHRATDDRRVG